MRMDESKPLMCPIASKAGPGTERNITWKEEEEECWPTRRAGAEWRRASWRWPGTCDQCSGSKKKKDTGK
jgi:hypothetical protein